MRHRAVALILAAGAVLLAYRMLWPSDKSEDSTGLTDMLTDIAENATEIARELESIDWSKTVRAVVYDADGEQVAEITDQAQIDEIFSPLSQVNGLAPTPDAEREYVVEIWEPETVKLGQSADDVGEYIGPGGRHLQGLRRGHAHGGSHQPLDQPLERGRRRRRHPRARVGPG